MSRYSRPTQKQKKEKVNQFKDWVPGATDKDATRCLEASSWDINSAVNYFYEHRSSFNIKQGDSSKLGKLFSKYADEDDENIMSEDGTIQFFKDISVDPTGMDTLVIAWLLKCGELGIIERQEFIDGFAKSGCSTIKDVKQACSSAVQSVQSNDQFKQFYKWLFIHTREDEKKKTIQKEVAVQIWTIVLKSRKYPLFDDWIKFVKASNDMVAISKDLWEQLVDFLSETKTVDDYDDSGAWPVAVDEFIEYLSEQK